MSAFVIAANEVQERNFKSVWKINNWCHAIEIYILLFAIVVQFFWRVIYSDQVIIE